MANQANKTDEELIQEYLQSKNPSSMNELFSRYLDVGFRTAMRYMRNQSDAEDVLQLALIQFLNNLHHFREGATTVKPWLMKMIVNSSIKKLQEENSRKHRQDKVASHRFAEHARQEDEVVEVNSQEDVKIQIKKLVDNLPEKYRSPIWLVLYEGFTYPEVASVLELPEKTVRTQVSRGLERLREILGTFGSVLSVDAIVLLMSSSTLDLAPITTKKMIESPELYKGVATKSASTASQSARVIAISKSSFLSLKFILPIVFVGLAIGSWFYIKNQINKRITNIKIDRANRDISLTEKAVNLDTNQTWDFTNEKDRNLPLKLGQWEWSQKFKGMAAPIDKPIIISLPIALQTKPFVIECYTTPNISKATPHINLYFSSFWTKNNQILKHEGFKSQEKYLLNEGQQVVQKIYYYNNHIYTFVGKQCIRFNRYTQDLSGTTVCLFSKNFIYYKITSRTLEEIPKELINANEEKFNLTSDFMDDWVISEKNFLLKN